jgi:hypothetical protein
MTSQPSSFAAAVSSSVHDDNANQDLYLELYSPAPSSMTLVAALLLLDSPLCKITEFNEVYLLSKDYLQNWLTWAYHQPATTGETRRQQLALRKAAEGLALQVPKLNDPYHDPGPIDSSPLSDDKYPLVLRQNVVVWDGTQTKEDLTLACAVPERFYQVGYVSYELILVAW